MKQILHFLGIHDWTLWGAGNNEDKINLSAIDKNGHVYQARYCRICHKVQATAVWAN